MATIRNTVHPSSPLATSLMFVLSGCLPAAGAGAADAVVDSSDRRIAIADLPELKDRISAFRRTLRDVTVDPPADALSGPSLLPASLAALAHPSADILFLESRFEASELTEPFSYLERLERPGLDEPPGMPGRRDLVFEEQWFIAGREDEYQDAARHWLGRRLKGSDRRQSGDRSSIKAKFAWDHGPLLGLGRGGISVRAGNDQWRLRWSKRWNRSGGPWRAQASVGEEDGDFRAEFLIGRSLLDSRTR